MLNSFKDINGKNISFENYEELKLDEQRDIETNEVTAYLVFMEDSVFEVSQNTYNIIKEKKHNY